MKTNSWRLTLIVSTLGFAVAALPQRSYAAGEVRWFNLLTEDQSAAVSFYSRLFGWDIEDSPTGALMAVRGGIPIAGISQIEGRLPDSAESLWLAAIKVDDIEASVAKARELGATIHEDVTRLEGWGTYALIQDPQGAPALLVMTERVLGGREDYSGWAWAELWTHDTEAAIDFYRQVVGYELETAEVGGQPYSVFTSGGTRLAGIVKPQDPELAPRWAPYVGVTDLRGILVRVWQYGGRVLLEPSQVPSDLGGEGRVALIADPTGAAMFLYQLDEAATADPNLQAQQLASTPRAQPSSGARSNVNVSVNITYGFGPGWGAPLSMYPYRPLGPPIYR